MQVKLSDFLPQGFQVEALLNELEKRNIPHALIICGDTGVGKRTLARLIATAILCENPGREGACGKCASCLQNENLAHPDFFHVQPGNPLVYSADKKGNVPCAVPLTEENKSEAETILSVEGLTLTYGAKTAFEKTALSEVDFAVHKGEFLGIIGHTGSGKSTLVQLLNGLLKPTEGTVSLYGRDIWKEPKKIRSVRFKVGMVFQYPEYQLFEETVYKDIAFGPKNMGLSDAEIDEKVHKAAAFAGLPEELLEKSPFDLSGGEKRRAAIAGVMAMDPDVLILDEPAAGLDPLGRDVLLSQIRDYHAVRKNTVLLVSHSMEDIAKTVDRILVMNRGKKKMLDTTQTVFSHGKALETMGLRVPQITKVMLLLREKGYPVNTGVLTVEQAFQELLKHMTAQA